MQHDFDKATTCHCFQDVLPNLSGSDAVNDWVETAREQQVHGAEKNSTGGRKTIFDLIRQERDKCHNQGDAKDHNMRDAGVQCFNS